MRTGLCLAVAAACCCGAPAQKRVPDAPQPRRAEMLRVLSSRLPDLPSVPPSVSIPVDPLGFAPPGPIYLGQRNAMASLDFMGENRLLFTFRVPGLIRRDPNDDGESDERKIRALVLDLPTGTVEEQALWTVHDRSRYLWMLHDGRFVLRDRETLLIGNASLELKPWLRFPGPVRWLELDPTQQYVVTDSVEPAATPNAAGEAAGPVTASATADGENANAPANIVLRVLRLPAGNAMLVTRVRTPIHLAINSEGYLDNMRGKGDNWIVSLNYFSGGTTNLGSIDSNCGPSREFVADKEFLMTGCQPDGTFSLVAMTTEGRTLWQRQIAAESIWPLLTMAPDGSRFARETLSSTHMVSTFQPLSTDDIQGQLVRVFDAATGNVALETSASPVLDVGGNVAISPSGRRVAVLNAGAIQIFDLPAPPPLPADSTSTTSNPAANAPRH